LKSTAYGLQSGTGVFRTLYIGETYSVNRTHERWCQSNELIQLKPLISKQNNNRNYIISSDFIIERPVNSCTKSVMVALLAYVDGTSPNYHGFATNYTKRIDGLAFACA
jgi:hypothetical protein